MFVQLLASIFILVLIFLLSIAAMIWGWGLEPQSWGWIIWGYVGVFILGILSNIISNWR